LVAVIAKEAGHLGPHCRFDHVLDHRAENRIEVIQAGDLSLEHLPGKFITVNQHENLLELEPLSGGLHSFCYRTLAQDADYLLFRKSSLSHGSLFVVGSHLLKFQMVPKDQGRSERSSFIL